MFPSTCQHYEVQLSVLPGDLIAMVSKARACRPELPLSPFSVYQVFSLLLAWGRRQLHPFRNQHVCGLAQALFDP